MKKVLSAVCLLSVTSLSVLAGDGGIVWGFDGGIVWGVVSALTGGIVW